MSHKETNPVTAENLEGMHVSVLGELVKVLGSSRSTLQRDLRFSNVMRSYTAILVFTYQQFLTAERLLTSFSVDEEGCRENFWRSGKLVVAELLHLTLQRAGVPDAHKLVNRVIVPRARASGNYLHTEMDFYTSQSRNRRLKSAWRSVPRHIRELLAHPNRYLGRAVEMAKQEAKNEL